MTLQTPETPPFGGRHETADDLAACLARLKKLLAEALAVDVPGAHKSSRLNVDVFPRLRSIYEQTIEALEKLEGLPAEGLGDLCYLASSDLRQSRRQLDQISPGSSEFSLLSLAEDSTAKLVEGLCAVEARLAKAEGVRSLTRSLDLRIQPLRIRRLVAKFRQRLAGALDETIDPEAALRLFGSSLAWLQGQDDFSQIRASERLLARDLQEQILTWLRSPQRDGDRGRRIRDELSAFVSLIGRTGQGADIETDSC